MVRDHDGDHTRASFFLSCVIFTTLLLVDPPACRRYRFLRIRFQWQRCACRAPQIGWSSRGLSCRCRESPWWQLPGFSPFSFAYLYPVQTRCFVGTYTTTKVRTLRFQALCLSQRIRQVKHKQTTPPCADLATIVVRNEIYCFKVVSATEQA